MRAFFLSLCFLLPAGPMTSFALPTKVKIADNSIALELPDGWKTSDLNSDQVLAGYASSDNATSVFFRAVDPASTGSMADLMDYTVANFEQQFQVKQVNDSYKTGQVQGPGEKKWPAIFTTMEAMVPANPDPLRMKFYLLIFDTGDSLYFMQGSTTMPVRDAREKEVLAIIKSIVARKKETTE